MFKHALWGIPLIIGSIFLSGCSTGPVEASDYDGCRYGCTYPGYTGPARSEESPIDRNNRENSEKKHKRETKEGRYQPYQYPRLEEQSITPNPADSKRKDTVSVNSDGTVKLKANMPSENNPANMDAEIKPDGTNNVTIVTPTKIRPETMP